MRLARALVLTTAFCFSSAIQLELAKFKNPFSYNLAMANHVQIVALDTIISNQKNMATLQQKYKEQHGEEKTGAALEARIRKAHGDLTTNPELNSGNKFYDALRAMMFSRQEGPGKPRSESKRPPREAPPTVVPAKVAVETEKLVKPFQDGDLPKLLEDSKVREDPIGGDYTKRNAAIEVGRVKAVQMMISQFISLHLERGDTLFFAFLDKEIGNARGQAKKILEKIQEGELPSPNGKYDEATRTLVSFVVSYLNFYQNETFAEGDTPGSKFKEAMDRFNSYLKKDIKKLETGVVDEQTLGAITIYYGLVKGKTIEIPAAKGKPAKVEAKQPPKPGQIEWGEEQSEEKPGEGFEIEW